MYPQLALARMIAGLAAGAGTSHVVKSVILNNVTINTTRDAVKVWIGRVVIQGMVADLGVRYVNSQFDTAERWITKAQQILEKAEEENKEAEGS